MKTVDTEHEKTEKFELKLPSIFDVKPDHVVDLPARHKAWIFEAKLRREEWDDEGKRHIVEKDGWEVMVINRHGLTPRNYDYQRAYQTTKAVHVQQYLRNVAKELSKSKRTRTTEVDHDED